MTPYIIGQWEERTSYSGGQNATFTGRHKDHWYHADGREKWY